MSLQMSRRAMLAGLAAAPAAAMLGNVLTSRPALAGVGWGPGPNSGMPFWFGAYDKVAEIEQMMPPGRFPDLIGEFEAEGTYLDVARERSRGWPRKAWHVSYLKTGKTSGFQWSSSPFCSGSSFVTPTEWPRSAAEVNADVHLNCSRPPTYTGNETTAERVAKQRRVWEIAALGWLEPVWREKMMIFKRDYFVRTGLRDIRIVFRVCHELNTPTRWGDRGYRRAYGMMLLPTVGDYQLVQEALRRYMAVFLDVFGNTHASIPNDFAYADDQLWPYWNPLKAHRGAADVRLTCPGNAKLVGPNLYDHWPALTSPTAWAQAIVETTRQGWPVGLQRWLEWARSIGKPLAMGEVGLMTKSMGQGGARPRHEGWDNPIFISSLLDFCKENAQDIAFIHYFNRDNSPSPYLPAHLIQPWDGIGDPAIGCYRNPPGAYHRCSSRAFRQWMLSNVTARY